VDKAPSLGARYQTGVEHAVEHLDREVRERGLAALLGDDGEALTGDGGLASTLIPRHYGVFFNIEDTNSSDSEVSEKSAMPRLPFPAFVR
jgi:hypothetical protein